MTRSTPAETISCEAEQEMMALFGGWNRQIGETPASSLIMLEGEEVRKNDRERKLADRRSEHAEDTGGYVINDFAHLSETEVDAMCGDPKERQNGRTCSANNFASWWSVQRPRALHIPLRLIMFLAVGLTGTAVDLTILVFLLRTCPFALARALAIGVAMSWNWWLNRNVTFAERDRRSPLRQYVAFCFGCSIGAGINWAASMSIAGLLTDSVAAKLLAASLGCGSGAGFNFIWCMHVAYQPEKD